MEVASDLRVNQYVEHAGRRTARHRVGVVADDFDAWCRLSGLRIQGFEALADGGQEGLADFLKECGNVEKVEILPFHKMGEAKWKALGFTYELSDTPPPAPELVRQVRAIFEKRGLVTV